MGVLVVVALVAVSVAVGTLLVSWAAVPPRSVRTPPSLRARPVAGRHRAGR